MIADKKHTIYVIFLVLIILSGIALRILFFSFMRPLWFDECGLALNILNGSDYFAPLNHRQAAPQLFMYISKFFYELADHRDFSLRIFPLITSILSIFLFYLTAEKYLIKKFSILFAVFLFVFSYRLCYYSQEFKPYGSDVFAFLFIILSFFYIDKINFSGIKAQVLYGIICSLLLWVSFTSIFALAAVFFTLLIFNLTALKKIFLSVLITFISFIITAVINLHLCGSDFFHSYWADGFINKGFWEFVKLNITNAEYFFNSVPPLFVFLISLFFIFIKKEKDAKTFLILSPLAISLILSYFEIYPYKTRLILFLMPVFILICAKLIDCINFKSKFLNYVLTGIIIWGTGLPVLEESVYRILFRHYISEEFVYCLKLANIQAKAEDIIYISDNSSHNYEYYKNFIEINAPVKVEDKRFTDDDEYIKYLDTMEKGKTYYLIYAHSPNKQERLMKLIDWAKQKENVKIYADGKFNALIKFSL